MDTAKVFWTGRSQAVRLPQAFRVDAEQMRIERCGRRIILEPVETNWTWLDKVAVLDDDAVAAALEPVVEQQRPELSALFK